ncbi:serine/threonine-protein kinase [Limnoglobus roseus]|uniref:non-specific serine/threonine protein kinase n=1 Tax=Limnoglobus roseus TaxID=2598579 RepID=A0A5C1AGQ9_9BACT|nr:serine/threonine-protein kinase [Limnoglobus roseus]QEL16138.1 serine/threonine protein kinase [Limnoglobus roseus]
MEPASHNPDRTLEQTPPSPDTTLAQTEPSAFATVPPPARAVVSGFVLGDELGRGGMGVVYKAVQSGLNRTVALKMVLSGAYAGRAEVARFLGEAEAVAAIRHPHVIQVYEVGENDGRPFFAMEFLIGGSLARRLKDGGPMPPHAAAELLAKIADGVEAAHGLGIVHRDLKPDNILFDAADVPKVVDFGLAKRGTTDLTATGAIMGTPSYMAPEQAAGQTKFVGPAVDVYALGVILFECLTGRVPFVGKDVLALLEKIREESPPRVRAFAPAVPRDLETVVAKCLAKNPQERYPTAGALAADLRRHLAGERPLASVRGSSMGGVWAALDRGRHAAEFAAYSTLFLWLAVLMVCADCAMGLWMNGVVPQAVGVSCSLVRVFGVPIVVYRYAGRAVGSASSRFLVALWAGYLVGCVVVGLVDTIILRQGEPSYHDYVQFTLMAGVAFVALGPQYWGWCYAFGAGFLLLPFAMTACPMASAFLFALMWGVSLVTISAHLRRLSRLAAAG